MAQPHELGSGAFLLARSTWLVHPTKRASRRNTYKTFNLISDLFSKQKAAVAVEMCPFRECFRKTEREERWQPVLRHGLRSRSRRRHTFQRSRRASFLFRTATRSASLIIRAQTRSSLKTLFQVFFPHGAAKTSQPLVVVLPDDTTFTRCLRCLGKTLVIQSTSARFMLKSDGSLQDKGIEFSRSRTFYGHTGIPPQNSGVYSVPDTFVAFVAFVFLRVIALAVSQYSTDMILMDLQSDGVPKGSEKGINYEVNSSCTAFREVCIT